METEGAFLHHAFGAWTVGEVAHVGVQFVLGDRWLGEVEPSRPVWARRFAVAATDAPVVVDNGDAVGFGPGCFNWADLDAWRVCALVALDGHVIMVFGGDCCAVVMVVALLDVGRASWHFEHADVLDLWAAGLVILCDTCVDAFTAADTAGEIQCVDELDAVHGLDVSDVGADFVAFLHFVRDALERGGHVLAVHLFVVLLEELGDGEVIGIAELTQRAERGGNGSDRSGRGGAGSEEAATGDAGASCVVLGPTAATGVLFGGVHDR